jgi:hypothetical protein
VAWLSALNDFMGHARRQIDQIDRRVLRGEHIPHGEKVFSLFQPHTEWISKREGRRSGGVGTACVHYEELKCSGKESPSH